MVEVIVSRLGGVPRDFVDFVESVLKSFYGSRSEPRFVEVIIYGQGHSPLDMLYEEARRLGVRVLGDYPVSHEAWSGWPRIHVDYERCSKLDAGLLEALLLHEAAHSILHGSRSYYLLKADRGLLETLGLDYALEVLYLASTVIKDLEVHGYLVREGFREHVERYAKYAIGEASGLDCSSLSEVLSLAKLVSPCVRVDCSSLLRSLGGGCAELLGPLLRALADLGDLGEDWGERSARLVRVAAGLLSRM